MIWFLLDKSSLNFENLSVIFICFNPYYADPGYILFWKQCISWSAGFEASWSEFTLFSSIVVKRANNENPISPFGYQGCVSSMVMVKVHFQGYLSVQYNSY